MHIYTAVALNTKNRAKYRPRLDFVSGTGGVLKKIRHNSTRIPQFPENLSLIFFIFVLQLGVPGWTVTGPSLAGRLHSLGFVSG